MPTSNLKKTWPVLFAAVLFCSVIAGQAVRIQPFSEFGSAASILDLALGVSSLAVLTHLLWARSLRRFLRSVWSDSVWKWSLVFLAWAAVSLGINAISYGPKEIVLAALYLGRLGAVFFLAWFAASRAKELRRPVVEWFTAASVALVGFGFLILALFPVFRFMVSEGWDPHRYRLLSTFYDPNLFGLFLVLVMAVSVAKAFAAKQYVRFGYAALFLSSWVALYLTYSRSAWFAGLIAVPAIAWKYKKAASIVMAGVFVAALFVPTRLGSRFETTPSLVDTKRYTEQEGFSCDERRDKSCDPTGRARVVTLRQGWELLWTSPVIGVGYNAYGVALVDNGIETANNLGKNSIQGSSNSLLNVWATTGVIGLGLLLLFYLQGARRLFEIRSGSGQTADLSNALLFFTFAYVAASFFNNALFYLFIFLPWALLLSVVIPIRQGKTGTSR